MSARVRNNTWCMIPSNRVCVFWDAKSLCLKSSISLCFGVARAFLCLFILFHFNYCLIIRVRFYHFCFGFRDFLFNKHKYGLKNIISIQYFLDSYKLCPILSKTNECFTNQIASCYISFFKLLLHLWIANILLTFCCIFTICC